MRCPLGKDSALLNAEWPVGELIIVRRPELLRTKDPTCPKCNTILEYMNGTEDYYDLDEGVAAVGVTEYLFCPNCCDLIYDPDNPETVIGELT